MSAKLAPMTENFQAHEEELRASSLWCLYVLIVSATVPFAFSLAMVLEERSDMRVALNVLQVACNAVCAILAFVTIMLTVRGRRWRLAERVSRGVLVKLRYAECFDTEVELRALRFVLPANAMFESRDAQVLDEIEDVWEESVFGARDAADGGARR